MKEELHPFDEKIRSAFESLPEPTPPAGDWNALKRRLSDEGVIKSRKRRYFFFILITGAALSLGLWFVRKEDNSKNISKPPAEAINPAEQTHGVQIAKPDETTQAKIPAIKIKPSLVENTGTAQPEKPEPVDPGYKKLPVADVQQSLPDPEFKKEGMKDVPEKNENIPVESNNTGNGDIPVVEKEISLVTNTISTEKSGNADLPDETHNDGPVNDPVPDVYALVSPEFIPVIPVGILSGYPEENPGVFSTATVDASVPVPPPDVIQSRWRVGIYTAWDRNRYRISAKEKANDDGFFAFIDSAENFQSAIGAFGSYLATCHLEISAGVRYSQKKKYISEFGNISDNPADSTYFTYRYNFSGRYLQIPVLLDYNFRLLNQDFYAAAGIIPAFNIPENDNDFFARTVNTPEGIRTERVNLESRSMGLSASVGVGIKINVYKGIAAFIEPAWQYALHPVIKHPTYDKMPVNPFINTMSIGAGAIYIFNTRQRTRPSICL